MKQLSFPCHGHGGYRPGAGRKRGQRITHHGREKFGRPAPLHAVWRTQRNVRSLRGKKLFRQIGESLRRYHEKPGFRVVHYLVAGTHLHFILEGDNDEAVSRGMQGLGVSIAKRVNFASGRSGAVFDDRYYARRLRHPRECANAVDYVLHNAAKHEERAGRDVTHPGVDPFSSEAVVPGMPPLVSPPETWLLRVGRFRTPG